MKHEHIPAGNSDSRETRNRVLISLRCEIRQGTRPWIAIRLEDVSRTGFRITSLPGCHPDTPLLIRIPGLQVLTAFIRWQKGGALGCEFDRPLHTAVFEHIVRQAHFG